ncbi:MAG: indole-3-glycerol phosphate synthase TrpC [Bacteroidota bacterium]
MSILETIVKKKLAEVQERRHSVPVNRLEKSKYFGRKTLSLSNAVSAIGSSGLITEFKRQSPSKGIIHPNADVEFITSWYVKAGAAALSVLTDESFFGGSNSDLLIAREHNRVPVLRKDFTIDEYQVIEAKAIGADAILLIAAILTLEQQIQLAELAHSLGLEVLLEIHSTDEPAAFESACIDLVGINNRNLNNFIVDINTSVALSDHIPGRFVKVSESGLKNPEDVIMLKKHGFKGFLIGENFMQHTNPGEACAAFIQELNRL